MTIGAVTKYNQKEKVLGGTANRQWDDATAGSCLFILCDENYGFDATHTTAANLTGVITAGDGAPINVANPVIDDTTTPGTTAYSSDDANFGAAVTISAKWLVCVQPVTAGTYATTAKVLTCVDLNTDSASAVLTSSASDFSIPPNASGWWDVT